MQLNAKYISYLLLVSILTQGVACRKVTDDRVEAYREPDVINEPMAPLTCFESEMVGDYNISESSGYEGNITYNCHKGEDYGFGLAVESVHFNYAAKEQSYTLSCDSYDFNLSLRRNYFYGTNHYFANHSEYGELYCYEYVKYDARPKDDNFTSVQEIEAFFAIPFPSDSHDPILTKGNCPNWLYEELHQLDSVEQRCHGELLTNYDMAWWSYETDVVDRTVSVKKTF